MLRVMMDMVSVRLRSNAFRVHFMDLFFSVLHKRFLVYFS
jgi:hypothetical protein